MDLKEAELGVLSFLKCRNYSATVGTLKSEAHLPVLPELSTKAENILAATASNPLRRRFRP